MSRKSVHPTLQDIADRSGFSRSAVSLALRNHPSLPEATRKKIRQAAEEIGYRPNPLVAALMAQLGGRRQDYHETVAVITRGGMQGDDDDAHDFYKILYRAISTHAAAQGLRVDLISTLREKMSGERLNRILLARGIHGILLFPGGEPDTDYPDLDWKQFATVLVGFNAKWQMFHQVVSDYIHDIDLALQMAERGGGRRIGLAVEDGRDRNINSSWSSRFLVYQRRIPARNRIPILSAPLPAFNRKLFLGWFEKYRPDTLLVAGEEQYGFLREAGYQAPDDVRVINLIQRGEKGMAGIDPRTEEVGRAAIDLLFSLLQSNQRGIPDFPRQVAVKGCWAGGRSFPEDSP